MASIRPAPTLPEHAEVVVVGSGILGAAIACNLAEAGVDVVVVERGDFCGEASGANLGLITVSAKPPGVLLNLARMGGDLYPTLGDRLGRDIQYRRPGTMIVATTPEELVARRALTETQQALGIDVRHLTGDEARELEPWLPERVLGGSFCPTDGAVYPFAVVSAYLARARDLGTRLVKAEVCGIAVERGRIASAMTTRGSIRTEWVVNAAGAWSGRVSEMVGVPTPVVPVRGQVLVTAPMPGFGRHVVFGVEPSVRQATTGNVLVGSVTEYFDYDKRTTLGTIRRFAQGAIRLHPNLAQTSVIRSWAGLRPGTPDALPILGASLAVPGFVIATGAFRNGMLYGPAIGQLIAEEILGRPLSMNIDELRPERFGSESRSRAVEQSRSGRSFFSTARLLD